MKIQKISSLVQPKIRNIQKFNRQQAPISFTGDIFEAAKLKTNYGEEFLKLVRDKDQRKEILDSILTDSSGNYDKNAENLFVETLRASFRQLDLVHSAPDSKNFPAFIEGARIALCAIKDEDKFYTKENDPATLTSIAYLALLDGNEMLKDLFAYCQNTEGSILVLPLQGMIQYSNRREDSDSEDIAAEFIRYCFNADGSVKFSSIPYITSAFNEVRVSSEEEGDMVFSLITDDDGKVDPEKSETCSLIFQCLRELANNEYKLKGGPLAEFHKQAILTMTKTLLDNAVDKDGQFDGDKAINSLKDWATHAQNEKEYLNNHTEIDGTQEKGIKTIQQYKNDGMQGWELYDTNFYRLYRLLSYNNDLKG